MRMGERGAVAVITAIFISALIGGLAIVADVGMLYQERRQLQTAVDSASLAGMMDIAEGKGSSAAENTAMDYLIRNANVVPEQVSITYPDGGSLRVAARTRRNTFFGRIFGITNAAVANEAIARTGTASTVNGLVPVVVPSNSIAGHIGPGNQTSFELGNDRPLDPFSINYQQAGQTITYTITYVNTGNKAIALSIWDPIPGGDVYLGGSASAGGVFNGTEVRWTFSAVAAGDSRVVSFKVTGTSIANTAYAQGDNGKTESVAIGNNPQRGFFWLTDLDNGSGGVPDYREWIANGYQEDVSIGDIANGTGMKVSLSEAVGARMAAKPRMILPVYDYTQGGGSPGSYHVVGFAPFVLTAYDFRGSPKTFTGYFNNAAVTTGYTGGSPQDFGVKVIWLSR